MWLFSYGAIYNTSIFISYLFCCPFTKKKSKWNDCMSILINIGTILTGIFLNSIILYLMVNKKISESQSVLWLLIGLVTIILGFFPRIINIIADMLGVWYPPTISFLVAYIAMLFIVLKNTVMASIHSDQLNEVILELVLAKEKIEKLERELTSIKKRDDSHENPTV